MSSPIQSLKPDYVLSVSYTIERPDTGVPTEEARNELKNLIKTLHLKGFSTQVRASGDSPSNMLVFIKMCSYKYIEEAEKDLIKSYEFGVTAKNNSQADRLRIVYQYLTQSEQAGGVGLTPLQGDWEFVKSVTPVTDAFNDSSLIEDVRYHFGISELSTGIIKEKYGVRIALYFEFLKFYIFWLIPLAILGLVSYIKAKKSFSMTYTYINLLWGILFITFWNRKQQYLVNFWGVQNSHLVEEHNSELAQLNQKYEEKSTYKHKDNGEGFRFLKQLAFVPIALGFTAVLISYQLVCFALEIFLTEIYIGPGKILLTLLPTILISVFVPILTIIYNLVANKIIAWENHGNVYSRENSILVKTFVLNFLTSYMPLLITSFIYLPFAHLIEPHLGDIKNTISSTINENRFYYKYLVNLKRQEEFKINQERLNMQYNYFIVTNQIIQLALKYVLPLILIKGMKLTKSFIQGNTINYKADDLESEKFWLDNVRKVIELPNYDVNSDFRGLISQYGYLIIFGPVWPLAPLISIIFNLINFKLDIMKLSNGKYFQPPIPERVDSIHPWNYALFLLTWLSSVISPIITAFYHHGTKPPKNLGQFSLDKASVNISSTVYLIFLMFITEHSFFVLYFVLSNFSNLFKSQIEWENDFIDNDIKLRHDYYSSRVKRTVTTDDDGEWTKFTADDTLAKAYTIPVANVKKSLEESNNKSSTSGKTTIEKESSSTTKPESIDNKSFPSSNSYSTSVEKSSTSPIQTVVSSASAAATSASATTSFVTNKTASKVTSSLANSEADKKRVLEEKAKLLEEKKAELEKFNNSKNESDIGSRDALEKIKDKGDSIIQSKDNNGNLRYSTIDNNEHFKAPGDELKRAKDTTKDDNRAVGDDSNDQAESSAADTTFASATDNSNYNNFTKSAERTSKDEHDKTDDSTKATKKKKSLKKLFKNKK